MPKDLTKELEEMFGAAPEAPPVVEPLVEEPPAGEPPVAEPPVEPPVAEPPAEEPPAVIKPLEEPPPEVPPVVEPQVIEPEVPPAVEPPSEETREELLARIGKLTDRIEDLTILQPAVPVVPKGDVPKELPPDAKPLETPVPLAQPEGPIDFLGDLGLDDALDSKEALNQVLNNVYQQAERKSYERVLLSIPDMVLGHVNRQSVITQMVGEFYKANEDLVAVKKTVGAVANTIHAENPDWELKDVFKEAAVRTRQVLGMRERVAGTKTVVAPVGTPAFAKAGGGKTPKSGGKTLQDEIGELLTS